MKYLICVVTAVVVVGDDVDMDLAHACLRMTHHDINLEYPSDARQHFEDIHNAMKRFYEGRKPHCGAGFCGTFYVLIIKFVALYVSPTCTVLY